MEYTKGEWIHFEDGAILVGKKHIASVFPTDRESNTSLIAAAPDMYEALKQAKEHLLMAGIKPDSSAIKNINQTLAKAEGK